MLIIWVRDTGDTEVHELSHTPTLEEAQALVGGYVEVVYLPDGRQMLIDEEGKLKRKPVNVEATMLYGRRNDVIVGDVVVLEKEFSWM